MPESRKGSSLLSQVSGKKSKRPPAKPLITRFDISEYPDFFIQSRTHTGVTYRANTETLTCTCPAFTYHNDCPHLKDAILVTSCAKTGEISEELWERLRVLPHPDAAEFIVSFISLHNALVRGEFLDARDVEPFEKEEDE